MFSWDGNENNHMTTSFHERYCQIGWHIRRFFYWVLVIVLFVFEMLVFELSFVLELFEEWTKIISEESDKKYHHYKTCESYIEKVVLWKL